MTAARPDDLAAPEPVADRLAGVADGEEPPLEVYAAAAAALDGDASAPVHEGNGHVPHACDRVHVEDLVRVVEGTDAPHDEEAEVAVVGALPLLAEANPDHPEDAETLTEIVATLPAGDFYKAPVRLIYGTAADMVRDGRPLDWRLLRAELHRRGILEQVGGGAMLARIIESVPTAANARHYARIVRECADRRRLIGGADYLRRAAIDGDDAKIRSAQAELDGIRENAGREHELQAWTLTEVEAATIEAPEAFVEDRLIERRRIVLLVAAPKTGKSGACLQLAKSVAAGLGDSWLGSSFTGRRCPVVYGSAEGGLEIIQERSRIIPPTNVEIPDLHVVAERPFPQLDTRDGLALLSRLVRKVNAGLVIIDPLSSFRSVADENDNSEAARFVDGLRAFADAHDVAMVIAHHPSKAASAEGTSGSFGGGRGASALFAAADVEISLRKDAKSGEIHATFAKKYGRPIDPGRRLRIDPATFTLEFVGDLGGAGRVVAGAAAEQVTDEEILAALPKDGREVSRAEWATAAGMSVRNLTRRIASIVQGDKVSTRTGSRGAVLFRRAGSTHDNDGRGHVVRGGK